MQYFCGEHLIYQYLLLLSKLEFSWYKVRELVSKYKRYVRRLIRRNKMQASKIRRVIKEDKAKQIPSFWKSESNRPLWIREIKTGVWKNQNEAPPWNAKISKMLKRDLGTSYRMLSWFHPKTQANDHIRAYWEAVIMQSLFADMDWEAIFIDEFKISSHLNKFKGWTLREHKPAISTKLDSFWMYFVLAVSSKDIYGVLTSNNANTAEIFTYFLDCLLKNRERLFKMSNTLVCKKMHHVKKMHPCAKKCTPSFGVFKKVLNNKNNFLVKVKFMKK